MKYTIAALIGAVAAKKGNQTPKMLQSLYTNEWQCWDEEEAVDAFGDGCDWYYEHPEGCGMYDDDDFVAGDVCCACDGGYWAQCTDLDAGATDSGEDPCTWYDVNVDSCGMYDDDDFKAHEVCCACYGGDWELGCVDYDFDTADSFGDGCEWYTDKGNWSECGMYDDDDFTASRDCCACGGGEWL